MQAQAIDPLAVFRQNARFFHESWAQVAGALAYDHFPDFFQTAHESREFASLSVGETATSTYRITKDKLLYFARATGDWNPAHMNVEGVKPFNKAIAHGFLVGAAISALLAGKLPGPGTIYKSQTMNFRSPVYIDDVITARVEIREIVVDKRNVMLDTSVSKLDGTLVLDGVAVVRK
jgi:3-hydroxybutyryl-CoA dehydratase